MVDPAVLNDEFFLEIFIAKINVDVYLICFGTFSAEANPAKAIFTSANTSAIAECRGEF